eukprot:tig00020610_g12095.t1
MDAIQKVVRAIQTRCKAENVDASETLCAFMARAIVLEHSDRFHLDRPLSEDDMSELVVMCVNRLKDVDSPSLASVKLQVEFDAQYSAELGRVEREKTMREKKINAMLSDIASIKAKNDNDFDALTSIYRKVFAYLVSMSGTAAEGGTVDRAVELEVAAALESVFPKIGLRAFVAMPTDEKKTQLRELASIVLGIRLFNKDIGKGGAGLEEIPALAQEEARAMEGRVRADKEELRAQVLQYLEVVNHGALPEKAMRHLRTELINRRQVGSCLDTVEQDLSGMLSHVDECVAGFDREMAELKALVGSKTSVPKEQVYPKFDSLAHLWHSLSDERQAVACLARVLETVERFRALRRTELTPKALEAARAARAADAAAARQLKDFEAAEAAAAGFQALAAGPAQDARTFARAAEEAAASSSSPPPPPPAAPERPPSAPAPAAEPSTASAAVQAEEEPAAAAAAPAGEPTDEADETGVSSIVREAGAQAAAEEAAEPAPEEAPAAEAAAEAPAAAAADGEAAAAPEEPAPAEAPAAEGEAAAAPAEGEAAAAGERPLSRQASAAGSQKGSQRGSFKAAPASDEAAPAPAEAAPAEAAAERPPSAAAAERPPSAAGAAPAAGEGEREGRPAVGEERGEGAERGRLAAAEHGGGRQAGDAHRLQARDPHRLGLRRGGAAALGGALGSWVAAGSRPGSRGVAEAAAAAAASGSRPASAVALAAVEAAKPPSAPGSVRSERAGSAAAAAPAAARPPSGAASAGRAPSATGSASGAAAAAGDAGAAAAAAAAAAREARKPVRIGRGDPEFAHARAEFRGFCPVTLVERDALLIPGNPNLGYVKFADAYYAISGEEAIWRFMATPERYVEGVLQAVRRAPELVRLLRLQQRVVGAGLGAGGAGGANLAFALLGSFFAEGQEAGKGPAKADADCQTSTHPIEKHIDPKYTWNEWELRRRALQLTNLRYKKTHSAQTVFSHFRRDNETQHYPPKDSGTQTRVDAGTNGPRMHNYIAGLRGDPDSKMHVVNLTLEL